MNEIKQWTDAERYQILDRRKKERELGKDPNFVERRKTQICLVCHSPFAPAGSGQVICSSCQIEGARGGRKGLREANPF